MVDNFFVSLTLSNFNSNFIKLYINCNIYISRQALKLYPPSEVSALRSLKQRYTIIKFI